MSKIDLKKDLGDLYKVSANEISLVQVPKLSYLMVEGKGDPNASDYQEAIEALFSVSYAIKFLIKGQDISKDYVVMPLESLWWAEDISAFAENRKDEWLWKAMILQPDFVTKSVFEDVLEKIKVKKGFACLDKMSFSTYEEGLCVQLMHIGNYSNEYRKSIQKLHSYIDENNYSFNGKHHDIYLNDLRKTVESMLKTIIRQAVVK